MPGAVRGIFGHGLRPGARSAYACGMPDRRSIACPLPLAAVAVALMAGLGLTSAVPSGRAAAQRYVYSGADSLHPRLRYADSLVSANDRCMVSQHKLSPSMRPVYVNGVPMGFC